MAGGQQACSPLIQQQPPYNPRSNSLRRYAAWSTATASLLLIQPLLALACAMLSPSAPLPGRATRGKKAQPSSGEARREWRWGQRQHAYYHPVIFLRTNPLHAAMLLLHFVSFWGERRCSLCCVYRQTDVCV